MNQEPVAAAPAPKPSYGAMIALVLVVAALAVAAFYLFANRLSIQGDAGSLETIEQQSDSTEPTAIQTDLSAQSSEDFDRSIDSAFADVDASFDAR